MPINQFSQNNITMDLTRCLAELGEIAGYYNTIKIHPCDFLQKFDRHMLKIHYYRGLLWWSSG